MSGRSAGSGLGHESMREGHDGPEKEGQEARKKMGEDSFFYDITTWCERVLSIRLACAIHVQGDDILLSIIPDISVLCNRGQLLCTSRAPNHRNEHYHPVWLSSERDLPNCFQSSTANPYCVKFICVRVSINVTRRL